MLILQIVCFAALLAIAYAASPDDQTVILKSENNNDGLGEYSFTTELSDGTIRHEEASWVDVGKETQHLAVRGFFIFNTPDGQNFRTDYTSDINGYNARGAHIPQ